jgi:hypothetical protein
MEIISLVFGIVAGVSGIVMGFVAICQKHKRKMKEMELEIQKGQIKLLEEENKNYDRIIDNK